MSRHRIGNVTTFNQGSMSSETSQMSRHRINVVTSTKNIGKGLQSNWIECCDIIAEMSRHQLNGLAYRGNVATSTSDQHVNVTTSTLSSLDSEISPMLRHRINVATSVKTLGEDYITRRYNVATSQQCRNINLK